MSHDSAVGRHGQPDEVEKDAAADITYVVAGGPDRPEMGERGQWEKVPAPESHPTVVPDQATG